MKSISRANFIKGVYDQYYREIYKFVLVRVYYQDSIAQDLVQDIFLKVWKYRDKYNCERSTIRSWVYTIARNHLIDFFRTHRNPVSLEQEREFVIQDDSIINAEDELMLKNILFFLQNLSEHDQELIQLRYMQELSIGEISLILGKSAGSVKVAVHRAIKKLTEIVNESNT